MDKKLFEKIRLIENKNNNNDKKVETIEDCYFWAENLFNKLKFKAS